MVRKKLLNANRVRRINGGFSFIPHRFLRDGFVKALSQEELLLYLFLVLACDRYGLSYYSEKSICALLGLSSRQYCRACQGLIERELIASDGFLFQVLELPNAPQRPITQMPAEMSALLRKVGKEMP